MVHKMMQKVAKSCQKVAKAHGGISFFSWFNHYCVSKYLSEFISFWRSCKTGDWRYVVSTLSVPGKTPNQDVLKRMTFIFQLQKHADCHVSKASSQETFSLTGPPLCRSQSTPWLVAPLLSCSSCHQSSTPHVKPLSHFLFPVLSNLKFEDI